MRYLKGTVDLGLFYKYKNDAPYTLTGLQMQVTYLILTRKDHRLVTCTPMEAQPFLGNQSNKLVLRYHQTMQRSLPYMKPAKSAFGYAQWCTTY